MRPRLLSKGLSKEDPPFTNLTPPNTPPTDFNSWPRGPVALSTKFPHALDARPPRARRLWSAE
eukprot:272810-Rhodomonas_salina.1